MCEPFFVTACSGPDFTVFKVGEIGVFNLSKTLCRPWNRRILYHEEPLFNREKREKLSSEEEEKKRAVAQPLVSAAPPQAAPSTLFS